VNNNCKLSKIQPFILIVKVYLFLNNVVGFYNGPSGLENVEKHHHEPG
jgi:hypothetical protein